MARGRDPSESESTQSTFERFRVQGLGFGVLGFGFWVLGLGFGDQGLAFRV